ncbi:hypothetical protein [Ornithinicoccus hortensis]|uniref:LPXTG-motif cell wall-anchored protein n=1 Tax=Ornithinicoccus hortensis TaxID=82346 RepID=A0A542YQQ9_9MICO|nr:hypothetical protein [Ornithinicoccus hortensis]TQL50254.1 hypothetical protein FB467_1358 [Ornithinicoccus hortensis]
MYNNISAPMAAGGSGGMLAMTGTNSLWLGLAAFALLALGAAVLRIGPRRASRASIDSGHWA